MISFQNILLLKKLKCISQTSIFLTQLTLLNIHLQLSEALHDICYDNSYDFMVLKEQSRP